MKLELAGTVDLGLVPQLTWLWYARHSDRFLVGDAHRAFALAASNPAEVMPLAAEPSFPRDVPTQGDRGVPTIADLARSNSHPLNLPIPDSLYDEEFSSASLGGLFFLPRTALHCAPPEDPVWLGDLLRRLCSAHSKPLYMLHRPTSLVLNLQAGSLQLFRPSPEGFTRVDETRTRGRQAMSFAAHPGEPLLAYVDNYGSSFAQEFSDRGFGKARKIDTWQHGGRALEFIDAGRTLVAGGAGHLASYAYDGKKFSKTHEVSAAVRDLTWVEEKRILLVNQGMHGLTLYRVDEAGFTACGALTVLSATFSRIWQPESRGRPSPAVRVRGVQEPVPCAS